MMYERLVMTCIPTLMVLIGLTLVHGTSSTFYLRLEEPVNCPTQKQMTIPDVMFFVNQTVTTIEATAEEVKQLKKRLDEMDVLLKSPDKPVETKQTETEFVLFNAVKLQDVPNIIFKLNSATPHWSLDSWDCLNEHVPKNWFEAYEDCRMKGMALASIESDEDYGNMTEQITALGIPLSTKEEDFWLSGTNLGHESDYVWMSTGRPVTVTNKWTNGQPDHAQYCEGNQKEHCMEINRTFGNFMNDDCCDKRQNYICERRKIHQ